MTQITKVPHTTRVEVVNISKARPNPPTAMEDATTAVQTKEHSYCQNPLGMLKIEAAVGAT